MIRQNYVALLVATIMALLSAGALAADEKMPPAQKPVVAKPVVAAPAAQSAAGGHHALTTEAAVEGGRAGDQAHGGESHGAAGGHGEPSLIAPPWAGIVPAALTLVIFLLLLVLLGKFAWGPIASGLKAREDKIRQDIADAEGARARAEATLREYEVKLASAQDQIRALMQTATADAEKAAEQIRYRGRVEAEEIKEKANREIEQSRDDAVRDIYAQAAELSTGIAEKIIRRNLNVDDQRDLVNESLNRLQAVR